MRIYILCVPQDDKVADQLGWLVSLQTPKQDREALRVQSPASAEVARGWIDASDLIVFVLSPNAVRVPWLAEVARYAMDGQSRGAPKLVVRAEPWPDSVSPWPDDAWPDHAELDEALRDAYPTSGNLGRRASQIAYYASFRLVQSGGFMGWQPTRPPDGGGFTRLGGAPSPSTEKTPTPAEPPSYEQPPAPAYGQPPEAPSGDVGGPPGSDEPAGPPPAPPVLPAAPPQAQPAPAGPPPAPQQPFDPSQWVSRGDSTPSPAPPAPSAPPAPGAYEPSPYPEQQQEVGENEELEDRRARGGADRAASKQKLSSGEAAGADASTLQFSAYHPNTLAVGTWHTLIVYTYLAEALAQIQADAATFTELGSAPTVAKGRASRQVEKGVELTVEPHMEGVTFSPEREAFIWRGDWRRTLFRFSGAAELAGRVQSGWIDIYAGPMVPVARIDLTFPFHDERAHMLAAQPPRGKIISSNIYDAVFISYSHRDGEAFRQACEEYRRFGVTVYTDQQLEAGADYEEELNRRIAEANVFHLLWSPHSAASSECRKEWMEALRREPSERFIKPWFWHQPLSAPPKEFVKFRISFKYEPLRRSLWRPSTWFA